MQSTQTRVMQSTQKQVGAGSCSVRKNRLVLVHAGTQKRVMRRAQKRGVQWASIHPKHLKSFDAEC